MNSNLILLKNLKNLLPYLLFIGIYFYIIGLEAGKDEYIYETIKKNENNSTVKEKDVSKKQLKIKIPVIPYKDKL
tara:strand:- start:491 stop:715 length:225 start_codon:yes stop_codon:yes gene_type:complete